MGAAICPTCGRPLQVPVESVMPAGMRELPALVAPLARGGMLPVTCDCREMADVRRACRAIAFAQTKVQNVAYSLCFDECAAAVAADRWNRLVPQGFVAWPGAIACGPWPRRGRLVTEPIPAVLLAGVGTAGKVRTGQVQMSLAPHPTESFPAPRWAMLHEIGGL